MDGKDAEATFVELAAAEAALPEEAADMAPEDWLSFVIFWALSCVVFLQFVTRYILNDSLAWTEEIAGYLLMVLCFAGSAMAARRGSHIAVEVFVLMLPAGARRYAYILADSLTVAFYAILVFLCFQVAQAMQFQPMIVVDVPLSVVYWGIMAGLVLMTLRAAQFAILRARRA